MLDIVKVAEKNYSKKEYVYLQKWGETKMNETEHDNNTDSSINTVLLILFF